MFHTFHGNLQDKKTSINALKIFETIEQPKKCWISRPYIQKPTIMLWHEILKVFFVILNLEDDQKLIVITWHWYN